MDRFLTQLEKPRVVIALIAGLILSYWATRMVGFTGLGGDEAEQVLFAQSWRWGYDVTNPPLYTWLLIFLFGLFGKSVGLVLALKLAILALIYGAVYGLALFALGPTRKREAALAALSLVLLFNVGWYSIYSYSHSLMNALFVVLTFATLLKALMDGRWRWYIALGVVLGLGILTKYSYGAFVLGLMLAVFSSTRLRERVKMANVFASFAIAGLICAPHMMWLIDSAADVLRLAQYKLQVNGDTPYVSGVVKGLWNVLRALFAFMSPLWLVVVAVFPLGRLLGLSTPPKDRGIADLLLSRTLAFTLLGIVGIIVAGAATQFRPNYLFFLVLTPLWLFLRVPLADIGLKRQRIYAGLVLAGLGLSVGGAAGKAILDPIRCKKCQLFIPYADIAQELRNRGFRGGTVFATWHPAPLPGNLALYLDEGRVISKKFLHVRPSHNEKPGQCLSVWIPQSQGGPNTENALGSTGGNFGFNLDSKTPVTHLEFPLYRVPNKRVLIDYVLLDPGQGDCR